MTKFGMENTILVNLVKKPAEQRTAAPDEQSGLLNRLVRSGGFSGQPFSGDQAV